MPLRIKTQCIYPYCTNQTEFGSLCEKHKKESNKRSDLNNQNRQEKKSYYSSSRWKRLRLMVLRNQPACAKCGREAKEVDHIIPFTKGGEMFDLNNLQALCVECHYQKSYEDSKQK